MCRVLCVIRTTDNDEIFAFYICLDHFIIHNSYSWPSKMAVVFSDVLFFLCKSLKRFDRSTILETLSKFYQEDELCGAKAELCKYVMKLQSDALVTSDHAPLNIDGWSKFVNSKGAPIVRKANEPAQRRRLEADDVLQMMMLLDVHKVELPTQPSVFNVIVK